MNKISHAVQEIHRMDMESSAKKRINNIHPLPKLILTLFYITMLVSFNKYDLTGISAMILYPLISMIISDISIKNCLSRMKAVLLIVCAVGIINPFLDKKVMLDFHGFIITGGMISMFTLMLKGIFSVMAAYILIVTTSIEKICYALRILHLPRVFVTVVLLIYRYMIVILKEAEKMTSAYNLRSQGEKGIKFKVWGSLVGLLLLRSMDRAEDVYESMSLRGYEGEYYTNIDNKYQIDSVIYFLLWTMIILFIRMVPVFELAGRLIS